MFKKLLSSCIAVAASMAFILPAAASASNDPQLTYFAGMVGTGSQIIARASNAQFTTTSGTSLVTCSKVTMTGVLERNSLGTFEIAYTIGTVTSSGTGAVSTHNGLNECTGTFGNAYLTVPSSLCIKSSPTMVTDEFQIYGCIVESIKFIIGSTTAGACEYQMTGAVKGDFTTGGTQTSLTVRNSAEGSGAKLIGGGFICPTSVMMKMTLTLEAGLSGAPITVS